MKLTKRVVESAPAEDRQYILWDDDLKGFGVYVNPKGARTYFIDYTAAGTRRRMTLGRHGKLTAEEARTLAKDKFGDVARGGDPLEERRERKAKRSGLTVSQLCDDYMRAARSGQVFKRRSRTPKKESTLATDAGRIERHIKPLLGKKLVADLTRQDIEQFLTKVQSGATATVVKTGNKRGKARVTGGAGTAARTVGFLGGILTYAVKLGAIASNPVHGVERPADNKRTRRLTDDEYRQLGKALASTETEPWQAIAGIRLIALTGCRKSEIARLRWEEVDLDGACLRLGDTKSGASVRPLGSAAKDVLASLPECKRQGFVFPGIRDAQKPYGALDTAIDRVMTTAKLAGVTAHVLRHSFASVAADLGYTDSTIGACLGHAGSGITSRYTHRLDSVLVAAANKIAGEVHRQMTAEEAKVVVLPRRERNLQAR